MKGSDSISNVFSNIIFALALLFPLFSFYYYYRWARNRSLFPFLSLTLFIVPLIIVAPYYHRAIFGQNYGLAGLSISILGFLFIIYFLLLIAGKIAQAVEYARSPESKRKKSGWYRESKAGITFVFKSPFVYPLIFLYLFLLLSLVPASYINGTGGLIISFTWYFSLILYIVIAGLIFLVWTFFAGVKTVDKIIELI